jgi:hypothetical protein
MKKLKDLKLISFQSHFYLSEIHQIDENQRVKISQQQKIEVREFFKQLFELKFLTKNFKEI